MGTVASGTDEEAAIQEGTIPHLKGNGLMGQISLQALLDQSTAPPGFYTGGSQDIPALQDLDRAKSTSYQARICSLSCAFCGKTPHVLGRLFCHHDDDDDDDYQSTRHWGRVAEYVLPHG